MSPGEREALLSLLAAAGADHCCYYPGAGNPQAWPHSTCDCKYLPFGLAFLGSPYPTSERTGCSEHTGCCELRAAYRVVLEARDGA